MISPSPRAAVCRVGDHLEVMCNATGSIVDWNIAFEGINDRVDSTVTSNTQVQDILPLHSTVFIFSRTSERGMLPLISILEITSVTNSLNGSTISCMDSSSAAVETTVYIIGDSDGGYKKSDICEEVIVIDWHA